jgi:hypothetical protein
MPAAFRNWSVRSSFRVGIADEKLICVAVVKDHGGAAAGNKASTAIVEE